MSGRDVHTENSADVLGTCALSGIVLHHIRRFISVPRSQRVNQYISASMISRDKEQNKDNKAAEVIGNSKELRGCM